MHWHTSAFCPSKLGDGSLPCKHTQNMLAVSGKNSVKIKLCTYESPSAHLARTLGCQLTANQIEPKCRKNVWKLCSTLQKSMFKHVGWWKATPLHNIDMLHKFQLYCAWCTETRSVFQGYKNICPDQSQLRICREQITKYSHPLGKNGLKSPQVSTQRELAPKTDSGESLLRKQKSTERFIKT